MPELPEIEVVKISLCKMVNKAKIKDIKIYNKKLRYKLAKNIANDLANEKILKISRRSKYLIFHFKKKLLLVHLGMTGKFLIEKKHQDIVRTSFYYDLNFNKKHNHIYFFLNNNRVLIYNDIRRFGFFLLYKNKKLENISFLKKLGLEPFDRYFNEKYFNNFVKNKKKNIKNLLMDQTFVSGLGNIYVNEVLFISKIHPLRACNSLNKSEVRSLIFNIKKLLKNAISKGGSSIRNFKNAAGKDGKFQEFFHVYGRNNENCSRISCIHKIKKFYISNRSSFVCNYCQS